MRGARLEDCRDVDIGYQSKLSHRARSERGNEWKPTIDAYIPTFSVRSTSDDRLQMLECKT
jgi:hypothetical protein